MILSASIWTSTNDLKWPQMTEIFISLWHSRWLHLYVLFICLVDINSPFNVTRVQGSVNTVMHRSPNIVYVRIHSSYIHQSYLYIKHHFSSDFVPVFLETGESRHWHIAEPIKIGVIRFFRTYNCHVMSKCLVTYYVSRDLVFLKMWSRSFPARPPIFIIRLLWER